MPIYVHKILVGLNYLIHKTSSLCCFFDVIVIILTFLNFSFALTQAIDTKTFIYLYGPDHCCLACAKSEGFALPAAPAGGQLA